MADNAHHTDAYQKGTMDLSEHNRTWHWFTVGVKWHIIGGILLAAFLAYFRTH